jgi:molybdate transport repressor ModE-like protein/molybdopterin-binding protein
LNVLAGRVESLDRGGGLAWIRTGRGRIAAAPWPGIRAGARVRVRVAPGDVILCALHPGTTSARNVLAARVRRLRNVPGGAEVHLDAGFPLAARVTRSAVREMGLRRGTRVFALVKAGSVGPDREVAAGLSLSLVGSGGDLAAGRIEFLRALAAGGSIAAAARARGVTYRTAWLWTRSLDEALGAPVVGRVRGGRGGGGVALTAEGRALLRRVDEAARGLPT